MGSRIMHSIIGEKIAEVFSIEDKTSFLLGSIAPDAVFSHEEKNLSHFFIGEAKIIALAQSVPPDGKKKWTVRLLTEYCAKLGYSDSISYPTVFRILKKNGITI